MYNSSEECPHGGEFEKRHLFTEGNQNARDLVRNMKSNKKSVPVMNLYKIVECIVDLYDVWAVAIKFHKQ